MTGKEITSKIRKVNHAKWEILWTKDRWIRFTSGEEEILKIRYTAQIHHQ